VRRSSLEKIAEELVALQSVRPAKHINHNSGLQLL
jgi:hypothetical protein